KFAAHLIGLSDLFPNRTDNVNHLPVSDPLSICAFALFTFCAGHSLFHSGGDTCFRTDGNLGLHAAFPQGELPFFIRCTAGATNSAASTIEAEKPPPLLGRMCRSSR